MVLSDNLFHLLCTSCAVQLQEGKGKKGKKGKKRKGQERKGKKGQKGKKREKRRWGKKCTARESNPGRKNGNLA